MFAHALRTAIHRAAPVPGCHARAARRSLSTLGGSDALGVAPRNGLSHVMGSTAVPLIADTIGAFWDKQAKLHKDRLVLVSAHQRIRWTYQDLADEVDAIANGLVELGITRGDRLGVFMPNNMEWLAMQLATAKAGIILANINPGYRLPELRDALNAIECKALVMVPRLKSTDYIEMVRELTGNEIDDPEWMACKAVPSLRHVFLVGATGLKHPRGMKRYEDILMLEITRNTPAPPLPKLDPSDVINIQFTSGTTGAPKGAALTHRGILNNGFFVGEQMKLTPDDKLCVPVPLYHCFGMVMGNLAAISHGSTIVYPSESFDPEAVLATVQQERCTALHGVPTMFITELNHPRFKEFDLTSLRTGIMAGSSCPIEAMKRVRADMNMSDITICYGQTETSPVSFQTAVDDPVDMRVTTVGRIQPHVEAKIVGTDGQTVPVGVEGELYTRGYNVMAGYWNDEERTQATMAEGGWMVTGDLAIMNDEGYTRISGRNKDLIIRGGENISPLEVENHLFTHPHIENVSVVGVPCETYGEVVCAAVIAKRGSPKCPDSVRDHVKSRGVAHFKVPHHVLFLDEFPTTVTGKIQKFKLRDLCKEVLAGQRH